MTLRLPEPVLARLRERSRHEGRSLNETAVHALRLGLGDSESTEDWRALGSLVAVPPRHSYDPVRLRQLRAGIVVDASGLMQELDWVRGSD